MCHGTLTFSHLKKRDNDFFDVFSYGTGTFFSNIIFNPIQAAVPKRFLVD